MSTNPRKSDIAEAILLRANGVLRKPFHDDELLEKLDQIVRQILPVQKGRSS